VCAQFPNSAVHDVASRIAGLQLEAGAQNGCVNYKGQMRLVQRTHAHFVTPAQKFFSNMIKTRLSVSNAQKRREIARTREQFGSATRHACHLALPISLVCAGL
jgi:hypothetical protein